MVFVCSSFCFFTLFSIPFLCFWFSVCCPEVEIDFTGSQFNFTMPDLYRYAYCIGSLMLLYAVFDFVYARHTKARYFAIHVLANTIVTVTSAPGLWFSISEPGRAIYSIEFSYWAFSANMAIHFYHIAAFNNLTWLDWLHHGIMTGLFSPIGLIHDKVLGPACDINNFFACGFPGGTDYALLFAVKHGWISSMTEKRWNTVLNVWIRSPGIVYSASFAWMTIFAKNPDATMFHPARLFELSLAGMAVWNAQYFLERVVGNYYVKKAEASAKVANGK